MGGLYLGTTKVDLLLFIHPTCAKELNHQCCATPVSVAARNVGGCAYERNQRCTSEAVKCGVASRKQGICYSFIACNLLTLCT